MYIYRLADVLEAATVLGEKNYHYNYRETGDFVYPHPNQGKCPVAILHPDRRSEPTTGHIQLINGNVPGMLVHHFLIREALGLR